MIKPIHIQAGYHLIENLYLTAPSWSMLSGRQHGILKLPPSFILFHPHLEQCLCSVGMFTIFSKHTTQAKYFNCRGYVQCSALTMTFDPKWWQWPRIHLVHLDSAIVETRVEMKSNQPGI